MSSTPFNPFYERVADKLCLGVVGRILLCVSLGLLFYLPYFSLVGATALRDWSWLLALLTSTAMLFLYYATATLRNLFPVWTEHIEEGRSELFLEPLNRFLCDRNFIFAAIVVGIVNLSMALIFGVDLNNPAAGVLCFGYFLAGAVCGLPAMGIIGVVATFRSFTKTTKLKLDYSSPDRCGGLSFMGSALVKFSVVTLLEGVFVATYILLADWTRGEHPWVLLIMWGWVVFPFFWSLLVLILPSIDLNLMLSRYRQELEQKLKLRCLSLREQIENQDLDNEVRETSRNDYEYVCSRREEVYNMRTWPFSVGATTSFVGAFLSNVVLAVELARSFLY